MTVDLVMNFYNTYRNIRAKKNKLNNVTSNKLPKDLITIKCNTRKRDRKG